MSHYFMQDTSLAFWEREMMAVPGFGLRRFNGNGDTHNTKPMYPLSHYRFPVGDGSFTGTLVERKLNCQQGLNCFFETADGEALKMCVWPDYTIRCSFHPKHSDLDISVLPIGTLLRVTYKQSKTGKTKWLEAEIVEVFA